MSATSNIDNKGIVSILFGNTTITSFQSICELYHNSDDSKANEVKMYIKEIREEKWFIFEDNGSGMNLDDIKGYLKVLNMDDQKEGQNTAKHGKYSFGGKQAILQLCGIMEASKNNRSRACLFSRKENFKPLFCVFDIEDLLLRGWSNTVVARYVGDNINQPPSLYDMMKNQFEADGYSGTTIMIKTNNIIDDLLADKADLISKIQKYFFERLKACKMFVENEGKFSQVPYSDPLRFDSVDSKHKNAVDLEVYDVKLRTYTDASDLEINGYVYDVNAINVVIINGERKEYLPYKNKAKHTHNQLIPFENKHSTFRGKISIRMTTQPDLPKDTIFNLYKRDRLFVVRNGVVVGSFKFPISSKTKPYRQVTDTCQVRLIYNSTGSLDDPIDRLFGVNMNKCSIMYKTLPNVFKKTLENYVIDDWIKKVDKVRLTTPATAPATTPTTTPATTPATAPTTTTQIVPRIARPISHSNDISITAHIAPRITSVPACHITHTKSSIINALLQREGVKRCLYEGINLMTTDSLIVVDDYCNRKTALGYLLITHDKKKEKKCELHLCVNGTIRDNSFQTCCSLLNILLKHY